MKPSLWGQSALSNGKRSGSPANARLNPADHRLLFFFVLCAWVGNALYAWGDFDGLLKFWSPGLVAPAMIAFVIVHGRKQWSRRTIGAFAGIVFATAWVLESLSMKTGFPFGWYHYGEQMRPFLGTVPVFVLLAYWIMAYLCWNLAVLFFDKMPQFHGAKVFLHPIPIIGAGLMVLWDLSLDPLRSTAEQRWHWLEGGVYHGIPLSNFAGWFFVTWVMLQLFAFHRARECSVWPRRPHPGDRNYWLGVPLLYLAFPVEYLLNPVVVYVRGEIGVAAEIVAIYSQTAGVTLLTMVPVALTAVAMIFWPRIGAKAHFTRSKRKKWLTRV